MIKINLLGESLAQATVKKPEKQEAVPVFAEAEAPARSTFPIAGVALGVILAAMGGVYYIWLDGKVKFETQRKEELQAKKKELEKYIELERTFRTQKEALQKKIEVMKALKANQALPVHLLEELANCLPDDVWFREISQKGMSISIRGEGTTFDAINQFRIRLIDRNKWFQNINYPAANKKDRSVEFTISCDLKNPA
jgi:Tfp pilus assembly protein PilN